jgi:hypothetical protein
MYLSLKSTPKYSLKESMNETQSIIMGMKKMVVKAYYKVNPFLILN